MHKYDPLIPKDLPPEIERLVGHPARTRWRAAMLLCRTCKRWPDWSYEWALATVDDCLDTHLVDFLVHPPVGWDENQDFNSPGDMSCEQFEADSLSPSQAMGALNKILGRMTVFTSSMRAHRARDGLAQGAGIAPEWRVASVFSQPADEFRIQLNEHTWIDFGAIQPSEGSISKRAHGWAEGFVLAAIAHARTLEALHGADSRGVRS